MKKLILFFNVIVLLAITSCKKYPDGPILSIHTKTERIAGLTSKEWDITFFSVNGNDSTSYLKSQPYYGKCTFIRDHDGHYGEGEMGYHGFIGGTWGLENNKENLSASVVNVAIGAGSYGGDHIWEIRRLTGKDLWLQHTISGNEYFVKLKN